jgi:hypothetical protein
LVAASDTGASTTDGITQDNTPTFAGTITGNYNEVYLELNNVKYYIYKEGTGAVNLVTAGGNWTMTMPTLADGFYNYVLYAKDAAGNDTQLTNTIRVKTRIEFTSTLEGDSGNLSTDFISNNTAMVFKGQTDPDNTITAKLYNSSNTLLQTVASTPSASGAYSTDFGTRTQGVYKVVFDVSDAAGNTYQHVINNVTIDTSAPVLTMALDSTSDTGEIKYFPASVLTDGITNVSNPIFVGTGEPGAEVTINIKNASDVVVKTLVTYVGQSGNWSFSPGILTDGSYTVSATASDVAGNVMATPATYSFTVKSTAPALTWTIPSDTNHDGIINGAEYAASATPGRIGYTGTGNAGDKVVLTISGQEYVTTVAANNTWSITTPPLSDFLYNFQLQAIDIAGNTTTVNNSIILDSGITVGTWMDTADDTLWQLDQITKNTNPHFGIATEKDNTLVVTIKKADGSVFYTQTFTAASNNFNWQLPAGQTYPDGNYTLSIVATDQANNTATTSTAFVIDTTIDAQVKPTINYNYPTSFKAADSDQVYYTNFKQFSLKNEVQSEITHFTVAEGSLWSYTTLEKVGTTMTVQIPQQLTDGSHTLTLTYTDRAGNTTTQNITVNVKSSMQALTWSAQDYSPNSGVYYGQGTGGTHFTGTAEAGVAVRVTMGGVPYNTTADASGNWGINVPSLSDGIYPISIYAEDKWGNWSYTTPTLVIDTFAPSFDYASATDMDSGNDVLWNTNTGVLSGRTEPGSLLTISIDGAAVQTVSATSNGNWTYNLSGLSAGTHAIVLQAKDYAGNTTTKPFNLTVDTVAPAVALTGLLDASTASQIDLLTNSQAPTFKGTGEPSALLQLLIDNAVTYSGSVGSDGNWQIATAGLSANAAHTYQLTATDKAGNATVTNGSITVDMLATLADNGLTTVTDSGLSNADNVTNNKTPTFEGTGEIGAGITFVIGAATYQTTVDATGNWTVTIPNSAPLDEGVNNYTITEKDLAGNTTQVTGSVTVDTQAPTLADNGLTTATDSGLSNADNVTNNKTPAFEGTGETGAGITFVIGAATYQTTVDATGNWTVTIPNSAPLDEGVNNYTITEKDLAGNTTQVTGSVTVDTQAPTLPNLNMNVGDTTFSGLLPDAKGGSIDILANGQHYTDTTIDQNGAWSVNTAALQAGQTVVVTISDLAGNTSHEDHVL